MFHYVIDASDKDWFIQQNILFPFHKTCQILLITVEEVNQIAQADILSHQRNPKPIELLGFKIPELILTKIRKSVNDQNDRSKALQGIANTIHSKMTLSALLSAAPKPTTIKTIQSVKPLMVRIFAAFPQSIS